MNGVERHKRLCDVLNRTYDKKNHDYGDSFSRTYKELGIISAVTRITDKYNRLVQMARGAEQRVHDETIRDTLLDMANYCIMTVMEIDKESKEVNKDGSWQEAEARRTT